MEAISPSFAVPTSDIGGKTAKVAERHRTPPLRPLAGQAVISVSLPLRFMVFGLVSLLAAAVLLVVRPSLLVEYHYNQYVLAVTHLVTLGFLTSIIMGAMYQLVPVALETKLHSERLASWQSALHMVGVIGMVWMFWRSDFKQVGHFGSVFAVGAGLFIYNIARTLRTVSRWDVVAKAIASSVTWLAVTILAGLALTASKCTYEAADSMSAATFTGGLIHGLRSTAAWIGRFDQLSAMHAHAHLGGIGFFLLLLVGVSYRLVPMFTLSEIQSARRAQASIWLLNIGLAGLFPSVLLRHPLKLVFALIIISGVAAYVWEIGAILQSRRRRTLDWGLRYLVSALAVLGLCCALAILLSWPGLPLSALTGQLENLYGFLFLVGVVGFAILGMLYKIIPFLVWYARYSVHIGRARIPTLADLYSPRLQAAGYWSFLGGLAATSTVIVTGNPSAIPWSCGLLLLSLLIFAVNVGMILSHLVRPRLEPLRT